MFNYQVDEDITLRLLQPRHADALFAVVDANREYLRQWLPWLDDNVAVADSLNFIRATQQQLEANNGFVAGIWHRGELAGVGGHNRIDWEKRISWPGYWLAERFGGKGVMAQSCRALITHAFAELNLNGVDIRCAVENSKSRAIPQRLGFRQEKIIHRAEWLYDKYVDHIAYVMMANEWRS